MSLEWKMEAELNRGENLTNEETLSQLTPMKRLQNNASINARIIS